MNFGGLSVADYHVHPDYSFDATGSIDEFCAAAIQKGLRELCFTCHYDAGPDFPESHRKMKIDGAPVPLNIENFGHYVRAVAEAHEKYYSQGLMVRCGVEVGYFPGCEEEISRLFQAYDFHYKLGAVHQFGDVDICNDRKVGLAAERMSMDEYVDGVFELLRQSASCGLFDALAHLDMYKWYGLKHFGEDILNAHHGRLEPLLEIMKEKNAGFELNTASLRKGHKEYYPAMDIVNTARKFGIPVTAIGSDAHRPSEVAFDFEMAVAIAHELFPYCDE